MSTVLTEATVKDIHFIWCISANKAYVPNNTYSHLIVVEGFVRPSDPAIPVNPVIPASGTFCLLGKRD